MFKTGPQAMEIPAFHKVEILAEGRVSVYSVDEDGQPSALVATSEKGRLRFRTKETLSVYISVGEDLHFDISLVDQNPYDKVDPTPVELPEEAGPATLEDRLKTFLAGMVAERFGQDSDQMETLEEALDFDMDDEEDPLSGYEVQEMIEDYPEELPEAASSGREPAEGETVAEPSKPPVEGEGAE